MKIALIGCGSWGKYILRDLVSLGSQVQVVARSTGSIKNAVEFGATKIVSSVSELESPNGVVVATTIGSHYEIISELSKIFPNIPIFCEKPVTDSFDQASKLLEKSSNNIFVMEKWRYHQGIIKLRELYQSGKFGILEGIHTTRLSMSNPHLDADAVWVLLPHDLSIVNEILGFIPEAQFARGQIYQDHFESLICQLGKNPWVQIEVSARSTKKERRIELRFERHILVLNDGYASEIEIYSWDPNKQIINPQIEKIPFKEEMPLLAELETFIQYLKNEGPTPKSSLREAVLGVERIEQLMSLAKL